MMKGMEQTIIRITANYVRSVGSQMFDAHKTNYYTMEKQSDQFYSVRIEDRFWHSRDRSRTNSFRNGHERMMAKSKMAEAKAKVAQRTNSQPHSLGAGG
jgi:hypothetical protein